MATPKYTALATLTLSSTDTEVVFSSIPAGYRDLVLVTNMKSAGTYASALIRFNSDTGSNYSYVWAVDNPTSFAGTGTNSGIFWSGWAVNGTVTGITQIMDYSATDKHKSSLNRLSKFDSEANNVGMAAFRWANTAAIHTISIGSFGTYSNPWAIGSTFDLFGVK